MRQARIIVKGRVQGVFFRHNTSRKARELGLKGFVRNLDNGDVEILAQGKEQDLDELIRFCHKGPPASDVQKVDVSYEDFKKNFHDFSVRY